MFRRSVHFSFGRRRRAADIHPENQQDVQLLRQRSHPEGSASSSYAGRARQDTCPICLTDTSVFTVQTNCGHTFCGEQGDAVHPHSLFDRQMHHQFLEIPIELDEWNEMSRVSTTGLFCFLSLYIIRLVF